MDDFQSSAVDATPRHPAHGVLIVTLLVGCVGVCAAIQAQRQITICRRTPELATARALEMAISNTYTEYGAIPVVGTSVTTNSPAGLKLLNILLGFDVKSNDGLNSRGLKFLSLNEGKNRKRGLIYAANGKSIEGLYDQWGNPYTVILDTAYTQHLRFKIGAKAIDLEGRRSAVFSSGPDKRLGTKDDIMTW